MKPLSLALLLSTAINGSSMLGYVLFRPLHERGVVQGVASHANAMADLVRFPGQFTAAALGLKPGHHLSGTGWWVMLAVNLAIYMALSLLLVLMWRWLARHRPIDQQLGTTETESATCSDMVIASRRGFLKAGMGLAMTGATAGFGYSFLIEPSRLHVTRRVFPLRGLPAELDGLRLVHITDVHHGPWLSLDSVRAMVAQANGLNADLMVLTGDYVHRSAAYVRPVAEALSHLKARIARVGVLGNHDWLEGGDRSSIELIRAGIRLVDNTRVIVTRDRKLADDASEGLCVAGIGDLWGDRQDYDAALGDLPPRMPRLLLSHNPDVAEERRFIRSGYRTDLMLSGHTHGGQIWIPGVGTPGIPSRYGTKYASGLVQGPICPVFISCGTGTSVMPLRFGVPPEIAVIELKAA